MKAMIHPPYRFRQTDTSNADTPAKTGEIVLSWGADGPMVTAPDRAAVPVVELFGMRRVPGGRVR
jgi:hypothetical protein